MTIKASQTFLCQSGQCIGLNNAWKIASKKALLKEALHILQLHGQASRAEIAEKGTLAVFIHLANIFENLYLFQFLSARSDGPPCRMKMAGALCSCCHLMAPLTGRGGSMRYCSYEERLFSKQHVQKLNIIHNNRQEHFFQETFRTEENCQADAADASFWVRESIWVGIPVSLQSWRISAKIPLLAEGMAMRISSAWCFWTILLRSIRVPITGMPWISRPDLPRSSSINPMGT